MTHTATDRPPSPTERRRVPAAIALAMAAGVALAGCSGDGETAPPTSPTTQATTSSSSSTPPSTSPATGTADPVSAPTASAAPAAPAPPMSTQLPANVVSAGGPCHLIGELAQADDGSPLFCLEDPGGAGPLWLPQPEGSGPDGTGPALLGRPCMQEGIAVTAPEGTVLTCRLTGGGDVPGGLFWQR
ncbi:hypothetical protein [Dietzia psychralcaliphila]|uniref:Ig-like domain-containing protein n=2 Tax=Dietzia psychralcaliphila TaxID=139021 RepID=A0AAD0NPC8_9ACTN|nr:hypothetical protein [Dietzia psychralcaliphila]AWH96956.1 hypothetical protein A6048_17240 [Dietzia psychralcaliphila]PTM89624.1 hypothetical protein C8N39_102467 [Dietzia psychralcaliphila]